MLVIDNKIVSDEIWEENFVCDLAKCKGGCCEDGDAGAPIEEEEKAKIREYFPVIKQYLSDESIAEAEGKGLYEKDADFGWVTPTLVNKKGICVYGFREKDGLIKCGFEQAYNEGLIPWKKPISCHLYPIIAQKGKYGEYDKVNYYPRETMCSPACRLGDKLKVPVYQFLKEAILRKYGEDFYNALDALAEGHKKNRRP